MWVGRKSCAVFCSRFGLSTEGAFPRRRRFFGLKHWLVIRDQFAGCQHAHAQGSSRKGSNGPAHGVSWRWCWWDPAPRQHRGRGWRGEVVRRPWSPLSFMNCTPQGRNRTLMHVIDVFPGKAGQELHPAGIGATGWGLPALRSGKRSAGNNFFADCAWTKREMGFVYRVLREYLQLKEARSNVESSFRATDAIPVCIKREKKTSQYISSRKALDRASSYSVSFQGGLVEDSFARVISAYTTHSTVAPDFHIHVNP